MYLDHKCFKKTVVESRKMDRNQDIFTHKLLNDHFLGF